MSYSRWSNSIWYTFWSCNGPDTDLKDDQTFEICDFGASSLFTYKQLKENIEQCLDEAIETATKNNEKEISKNDRDELKVYMNRFIEDIEEEYSEC